MRDENNFQEPDRYWPDRFAQDNQQYNPTAYIPFGDGPRTCIGMQKIYSELIQNQSELLFKMVF